jgi:sulfotransferase family protein
MTVTGQASTATTSAVTDRDGTPGSRPVVVLTYGHAGGQVLQSLLDAEPELACTAGTGVLPACAQAAAAWRQVDGRPDAPLSPLAVMSIRKLATQMITVIAVRTGRSRWCETAVADRNAAETFLRLFPDARFVCLHRACPGVISALLQASPWGLSGHAFAPYVTANPFSTAAALAAWWAAHAEPLLAFEHDHPKACLRVRFEDLADDPGSVMQGLKAFLGLSPTAVGFPRLPQPGQRIQPPGRAAGLGVAPQFPTGQVPTDLVSCVNELHAQLGYPPLAT